MKRFTALALLTGFLTVMAASAGDPVKGKPADGPEVKKDAPDPGKGKADKDQPAPEKGKAKKGEEGDDAKKAKELVKRIGKGMQRSEKRLSEKDPRETT